MFATYLDASGITPDRRWLVMAGFCAPVEKWTAFEEEWKALLHEPRYKSLLEERNGKLYAHARKMQQWRDDVREAFYASTNHLLKSTVSFAVGIAVRHSDYRKAYENYPLTAKDGIYGFSFRCAMVACCKNINEKYDNQPVGFVLEKGDPGQGGAKHIFDMTLQNGKMLDEVREQYPVTTFALGFKEDWGALQVADMHAYCVHKHLQSSLGHKYGATNEYYGDIRILLSELNHLPFRIDLEDIRDQRRVNIQNDRIRKEFGKRKYVKAKA